METKIVNCKVAHIRPEFKNLKEWCENKNNVYIGGVRYPDKDSIWANPFKVANDRKLVIDRYKEYIIKKLDSDPNLVKELLNLKGKNLGCWCVPEACHGHVLVELIEKYSKINN
jgi:hypothetical protein